jgi:hypothetical protein
MQPESGQQRTATRLHGLQHYSYGAPPVVIVVACDECMLPTVKEGISSLGLYVNAPFDPPWVRASPSEPLARRDLTSIAKGRTDL